MITRAKRGRNVEISGDKPTETAYSVEISHGLRGRLRSRSELAAKVDIDRRVAEKIATRDRHAVTEHCRRNEIFAQFQGRQVEWKCYRARSSA